MWSTEISNKCDKLNIVSELRATPFASGFSTGRLLNLWDNPFDFNTELEAFMEWNNGFKFALKLKGN